MKKKYVINLLNGTVRFSPLYFDEKLKQKIIDDYNKDIKFFKLKTEETNNLIIDIIKYKEKMMKIKIINNNVEMLEQAFLIRKKVFVDEQNVPLAEEIDEFEEMATHFLVFSDNNIPIATSRMRNVAGKAKIERVCVSRVS